MSTQSSWMKRNSQSFKLNAFRGRLSRWISLGLILVIVTGSVIFGLSRSKKKHPDPSSLKLTAVSTNLPAIANTITPFTTEEAFPHLRFMDMTFVAPLPDGSNEFLVLERQGRIQTFKNSVTTDKKKLFLDIADLVGDVQEMGDDGLSGIAFHPEYATASSRHRGEFFLHYTMHVEGKRAIRISKFTVPEGSKVADPKSEVVLIEQPDENPSHNGGAIMFGHDGFLYATIGDDDARHPNKHAQFIDRDLFSGVLRIDVNCQGGNVSHAPPRQPNTGKTAHYYIPEDNPWVGVPNALEEFYAIGLRNPWRASIDRVSGKLWVSDVGEHRREEVTIVDKGANCGWSHLEGTVWSNSHNAQALGRPEHLIGNETPPLYEYERDAMNRCIIGGYVYRGRQFPELVGKYVYADISGRIYAIEVDKKDKFVSNRLLAVMETDGHGISSFAEDADGELLICVIRHLNHEDSELHRLVRTNMLPSQQLPKLLSETGLFKDLKTLKPNKGLVPFEVNSPLWSDRAVKHRWIGLPAGQKIRGEMKGPWEFPVGTVFVKHFELSLDERKEELGVNSQESGGKNPATGVENQQLEDGEKNVKDGKQLTEKDLPKMLDPKIGKMHRLETRILVRDAKRGYYAATYRWNDDETDAQLVEHSETEDIEYCDAHGQSQQQTWLYPGRFECMTCHNPQANFVLGFSAKQLNRDVKISGRKINQLRRFIDAGMFEDEPKNSVLKKLPRLVSLDDPHASVELKVRSYLDSNCSHCHRPHRYAGRWDGRIEKPLDKQKIVNQTAIMLAFGDPDAKVVRPGDLEHSYLYQRMKTDSPTMRMPPLGRYVVHEDAVKLIKQWIESLPPATEQIAEKETDEQKR